MPPKSKRRNTRKERESGSVSTALSSGPSGDQNNQEPEVNDENENVGRSGDVSGGAMEVVGNGKKSTGQGDKGNFSPLKVDISNRNVIEEIDLTCDDENGGVPVLGDTDGIPENVGGFEENEDDSNEVVITGTLNLMGQNNPGQVELRTVVTSSPTNQEKGGYLGDEGHRQINEITKDQFKHSGSPISDMGITSPSSDESNTSFESAFEVSQPQSTSIKSNNVLEPRSPVSASILQGATPSSETEPIESLKSASLEAKKAGSEHETINGFTSGAEEGLGLEIVNKVDDLPSTVSVLTFGNIKIFLVGTAHFSTQSQEDVRTVIRKVQPDCLVLELCHSRRNILSIDEEALLREAGDITLATVRDTLRNSQPNSSRVQALLHLLLLSLSSSLTKKLGMAPGGEFRVAVKELTLLQKQTSLVLGDRPFSVTLSRAIASLSLWQRVKLGWQFIWSSTDITKEEIEKCKERDLLEKMLMEMTGEFPSITEVFVNERDYYMAHVLKATAINVSQNIKEGSEGIIVSVCGMGHLPGMVRNFGTTTEEEFQRVASMPPVKPPTTVGWLIKSSVKLSMYGLMGYATYKFFNRYDIFKRFDIQGMRLGVIKLR